MGEWNNYKGGKWENYCVIYLITNYEYDMFIPRVFGDVCFILENNKISKIFEIKNRSKIFSLSELKDIYSKFYQNDLILDNNWFFEFIIFSNKKIANNARKYMEEQNKKFNNVLINHNLNENLDKQFKQFLDEEINENTIIYTILKNSTLFKEYKIELYLIDSIKSQIEQIIFHELKRHKEFYEKSKSRNVLDYIKNVNKKITCKEGIKKLITTRKINNLSEIEDRIWKDVLAILPPLNILVLTESNSSEEIKNLINLNNLKILKENIGVDEKEIISIIYQIVIKYKKGQKNEWS